MLDSMFRNDEVIKLLMGDQKKISYVDINLGAGNGILSLNNNAFNAGQSQTNKIYYVPSVEYSHKTGFAIALNGYLAADAGTLKMYQYTISPSYTYDSKKIVAGVSYTRYIEGTATNYVVNPYSNDFYASALYKKTWLQPGIAVGYSFGKILDYFDTTLIFYPQNFPPFVIRVSDTTTTRLSSFSVSISAKHTWRFKKLLHKNDLIKLEPVIILNAGSQKWDIKHSNSLFDRRPFVQNYFKRRFGDGETKIGFNVQSLGFVAGLSYYYGKFYLAPQLYLDYYLPETTANRLTSLFSVTAGFTFY